MLACHLGLPRNEMMQRMSSSEFETWKVYYKLEPFGPIRDDLRAGSIAAPLVNLWTKKGTKKAKASDWIMRFDGSIIRQPWQSMKAAFKFIANNYKNNKKRKGILKNKKEKQSKKNPKKE